VQFAKSLRECLTSAVLSIGLTIRDAFFVVREVFGISKRLGVDPSSPGRFAV
jgi:hypothetical protein